MQPQYTLGTKVYGIKSVGVIVPTLISDISLTKEDQDESGLVLRSRQRLLGKQQLEDDHFSYRVLDRSLDKAFFTYDEAHEEAMRVLAIAANNDEVRLVDHRKFVERLHSLACEKEKVRATIESLTEFSDSGPKVFMGHKTAGKITAEDVPSQYLIPGTPVWIADPKGWALVEGMITAVRYSPARATALNYDCGENRFLAPKQVFKTKRGALNQLKRAFTAKFPGTLDPKRVPVVEQLSKAAAHDKRRKEIDEMVESMFREERG